MIYLDHNATTPIDPRVAAAMRPWLEDRFGNPSSAHAAGQAARAAVEEARSQVAAAVDCHGDEVVFTGGGTEADLLAVLGGVLADGRRAGRVVVSGVEHEAVIHGADLAGKLGLDVVQVEPIATGAVEAASFLDACTDTTVVAALMFASNETGVVQPVAELAPVLRERGIRFHTDAVQAIGKLPVSFRSLGVDTLALSAHKLGGPKGVGALIVRRGSTLVPLMGGTQEGGARGGTHNVAGIVGLGEAMLHVPERLAAMQRVRGLRDRLQAALVERVGVAVVHGLTGERAPNTLLIGFDGIDAAGLLVAADLAGLCISRGSACASGAEGPSHVLSAMGVPASVASGTIRLSLGPETTEAEIDTAVEALHGALAKQSAAAGGGRRS